MITNRFEKIRGTGAEDHQKGKKLKICFIGSDPNFDGGITLYIKNLINYLKIKKKQADITWIYRGEKNIRYIKNNINYIEVKTSKILFLEDVFFNLKVCKLLRKENFDIINSHALWGYWMKNYKKRKNQKIVHTYHGSAYYFLKNSLRRFGHLRRIFLLPLLFFGYLTEKPPIKKADNIICVSEKVKRQMEKLYEKRENIHIIRTGVDLKEFKLRNKNKAKKEVKLEKNEVYGLYVGRGGFWTKGLDRVVKISEKIFNKEKNFKLIVIGPDRNKVKNLINKEFIIYSENVPREKIKYYYNASDVFFCMSRYEGGAPTLVTSEAMASGCFVVCSKDSEQEIIKNEQNGLILENFNEKDTDKIIKILKNNSERNKIINNSINTIKELSLEKWGERYLEVLLK